MLVLSRKPGQRIQIGNQVTLVVLGVSGNKVRLGFEGSPDVPIHRGEVYSRLLQDPIENGAASHSPPEPLAI